MKQGVFVLSLLLCFALTPVFAMEHDKMEHDKGQGTMEHGMDQGTMEHGMNHEMMDHDMDHGKMDHDGMQMHGNMIMLGEKEVDGVKANIHMKDVHETMAKMGMDATHHFMVALTDAKSGKTLEDGVVAIKIKGPKGEEGEAIQLMGMQGHFGIDVSLKDPGEYHFTVATKLADGKTRKFTATFKNQAK